MVRLKREKTASDRSSGAQAQRSLEESRKTYRTKEGSEPGSGGLPGIKDVILKFIQEGE